MNIFIMLNGYPVCSCYSAADLVCRVCCADKHIMYHDGGIMLMYVIEVLHIATHSYVLQHVALPFKCI
jgi:hypothetical protein